MSPRNASGASGILFFSHPGWIDHDAKPLFVNNTSPSRANALSGLSGDETSRLSASVQEYLYEFEEYELTVKSTSAESFDSMRNDASPPVDARRHLVPVGVLSIGDAWVIAMHCGVSAFVFSMGARQDGAPVAKQLRSWSTACIAQHGSDGPNPRLVDVDYYTDSIQGEPYHSVFKGTALCALRGQLHFQVDLGLFG
jgi:hypothetical protein